MQMIPNEAAQARSIPKQGALKNTANEAANQVKPAEAMQTNMPVNQVSVHMDNQQAEQQAAPQKQGNMTPLPTQEAQQSEGARIAQPQPTINEQNAQMDARLAEIKKQPLMNGEPEALEHVQRTYGDLLNTITPAARGAG